MTSPAIILLTNPSTIHAANRRGLTVPRTPLPSCLAPTSCPFPTSLLQQSHLSFKGQLPKLLALLDKLSFLWNASLLLTFSYDTYITASFIIIIFGVLLVNLQNKQGLLLSDLHPTSCFNQEMFIKLDEMVPEFILEKKLEDCSNGVTHSHFMHLYKYGVVLFSFTMNISWEFFWMFFKTLHMNLLLGFQLSVSPLTVTEQVKKEDNEMRKGKR